MVTERRQPITDPTVQQRKDSMQKNLMTWSNAIRRIPRVRAIPSLLWTCTDADLAARGRRPDGRSGISAAHQRAGEGGGARVIMVSAAPTRELQRVASLLDLGDQPGVAELGHVILPAVLQAPPRLPSSVTPTCFSRCST